MDEAFPSAGMIRILSTPLSSKLVRMIGRSCYEVARPGGQTRLPMRRLTLLYLFFAIRRLSEGLHNVEEMIMNRGLIGYRKARVRITTGVWLEENYEKLHCGADSRGYTRRTIRVYGDDWLKQNQVDRESWCRCGESESKTDTEDRLQWRGDGDMMANRLIELCKENM